MYVLKLNDQRKDTEDAKHHLRNLVGGERAVTNEVLDLIYGRWRSQILYAGAAFGIFDHLSRDNAKQATAVAAELHVDAALLYRLMRALASLGLLIEDDSRDFATSELGELFRSDHPRSLRYRVLCTEAPEHYAIWKHLPDIIRDGKQDGFVREFGAPGFEYARVNVRYRRAFDRAMTSHSVTHSQLVLEALQDYDFSSIRTICDIGGGHGHLMCSFLKAHPHLSGMILDLPEAFNDRCQLWATKLGLEDRCTYVGGDIFKEVPAADAYSLKMILHDWSDQECIEILVNLSRAVSCGGRVLIVEQVVPGPGQPHFAKLCDIQMMCGTTGRERTEDEYVGLLEAAGWKHTGRGIRPTE
jgi:hypothetical protein